MANTFKKIRQFIHKAFSGYYNILLYLLILLIIFRPYGNNIIHLGIWQLLLTCTLLSSIFNSNHSRKVKIAVSILAIPTVILCWANLLHPEGFIFIGNIFFIMLFMSITASSVISNVIIRARVTLETLRGVVCAYLMVALLFAYLYYLIEFISPNSFLLPHQAGDIFSYAEYLSKLLYFSFVTLLTVGFGDIVPIKTASQTAVILEGIIGQFYIAILVARIVSVYSFFSEKKLLQSLEEDIGIKKKKTRN
jgi:hypothetical protein